MDDSMSFGFIPLPVYPLFLFALSFTALQFMTIFVVLPLKGFWGALRKFGAKFAGHPSYNFSWDRFVTGIMQLDCGRVIFILTVF